MPINVGDRLPDATFRTKTADGLGEMSVSDLTAGKKVVIFAVPGAFTPTCHAKHMPGFLENHDALKAKGVDTIACVTVNDPFVAGAWSDASGAGGKVQLLADWDGSFTNAIGLAFDGSGAGLGSRSKRYAMIVEDGVVKALMVEESPGVVEATGANKVLAAL